MVEYREIKCFDPIKNLSLEEDIFLNLKEKEFVFLIYINSPCVVLGKNQNPWRELNPNIVKENNILVTRRITGGGTVYHDLGNINFSLISTQEVYDKEKLFQILLDTFAFFNIHLTVNERSDLYYKDYKISGNAFTFSQNKYIHHGTLLIDTNIHKYKGLLRGEEKQIEGSFVSSKHSKVINLREVNDNITVEKVLEKLKEVFFTHYPQASDYTYVDYPHHINEIIAKRSQWQWIYGRTPNFKWNINLDDKKKVTFLVKNGTIEKIEGLENSELLHKPFTKEIIKTYFSKENIIRKQLEKKIF